MDFQLLKYFKTVAETGKISDAADALFISAPALSLAISRLEKELDAKLFDRTNNRIILNRQGEIFLRYAKQVLTELEYTKSEIRQSLRKQQHHISLACVSPNHLVDLISGFSQEYPEFTLSCTSIKPNDLEVSGCPCHSDFLLASEIDIHPFLADELESIPLFEDKPVIMVHPEHPLAQRKSVCIGDLINETLFIPSRDYSLYYYLKLLFEQEGHSLPEGNAYTYLISQQMASEGLGVAFASEHYAHMPTFKISYIPIDSPCSPWIFRLYWKKNKALSENETALKNFAEKYYRLSR